MINSSKKAIIDYSVVLLIGSLIIGFVCGESGNLDISPLTSSLFKGMLSIFLLAMGVSSAQQLYLLKKAGLKSIVFGIVAPICMSTMAIIISWILALSVGDSLLLAMLFGSASYIAVPAAMSETIPEGNIGLMIALALVVTFIFNISLGIPLYLYLLS